MVCQRCGKSVAASWTRCRAYGAALAGLGVGQSVATRYDISPLLGSGGMGGDYQAWDAELAVAVAIEVIPPEGDGRSESGRGRRTLPGVSSVVVVDRERTTHRTANPEASSVAAGWVGMGEILLW
jgi:hypothetical protein